MEPTHLVLLLAVLAAPLAAVSPGFPLPYNGLPPYAYLNYAPPNTPFKFPFNYPHQTQAFLSPQIPPFTIPATSFSRAIYAGSVTSKIPQGDLFRGFSYQTKYDNGGRSEVVFVTGPESKELMERNMQFFYSNLLPQNKPENKSESTTSRASEVSLSPGPQIEQTTIVSTKAEDRLTSSPTPNIQQSSVFRFQLFPSRISPLLSNPFSAGSLINSYFHTFGHYPPLTKESTSENGDQYNAEAQESMVSEVGTDSPEAIKPAGSKNAETSSKETNFAPQESNTIADIPANSQSPDTTIASTSENNTPTTEQINTVDAIPRSNEISSPDTPDTNTSQQISTSTKGNSLSATETAFVTELQPKSAVNSTSIDQNEEITSTQETPEETTQISETLAEST